MSNKPILNGRTLFPTMHRWFTTHPEWVNSLSIMCIVIISYEVLWQTGFYYDLITKNTFGLVVLVAIMVAAFRYGMRPGIVVAIIANAYTFFAYTAPGRHVATLDSLIQGEWFIAIIFFGPAIMVGYLRSRVNELLAKERHARSQAEQEQIRLTTILEQLPVGVVIADATTGNILFGNQYLDQLLTHVPHPATSKDLPSLPLEEWPLKQVLEGQTLSNEEYSYLHNGHSHVMRINGSPIYYQNNITAGVVIIDDITNEKEIEQRKDDFLSMVSHELKTPLTSLKMYLQLASRQLGSIDEVPAKSLAKAESQADKLNQLINDMLVLARTQVDKMTYRLEFIDLSQLVDEAVDDIQATNPRHRVTVKNRIKLMVQADKDRLSQVIINLVTNAIKYSPDAHEVIINLSQQDNQALLSVQDFGIGIDNREQEHIFERFYQADHKSGGKYSGLGIGLYLAAEIIKSHQGRIWVKSMKGKGSTFFVSLPLTQAIPDFSSSARSITKAVSSFAPLPQVITKPSRPKATKT
jgi:PAS domain S-box-containing protein